MKIVLEEPRAILKTFSAVLFGILLYFIIIRWILPLLNFKDPATYQYILLAFSSGVFLLGLLLYGKNVLSKGLMLSGIILVLISFAMHSDLTLFLPLGKGNIRIMFIMLALLIGLIGASIKTVPARATS